MRLKVAIGGSVLGFATLLANPAWAQGPGDPFGDGLRHAGTAGDLGSTMMRAFSGADPGASGGLRVTPPLSAGSPAPEPLDSLAPAAGGPVPALGTSSEKIRTGMQLLMDTFSTVGVTEVERERISEWDTPRDPRRRYALTPQVGEDSRLILNRGLVGFRHRVDEKVDFGATFGESYDLADPDQKALKVQLNVKF